MSKEKICYRNEPFMARVFGKGEQPIKCTPIVYNDKTDCGVGILDKYGIGLVWGLLTPRDLIASWRATEILRHLDVIEHGTLSSVYYSGKRKNFDSDIESYVNPIIAKIGQDNYDRIMKMPIPEKITRTILDNQNDEWAPDLSPITDEVRAGTIEWRNEFTIAGVKHPDEVDRQREQMRKKIQQQEKGFSFFGFFKRLKFGLS